MSTQSVVRIFTDGSCLKNPGPGGWAALLVMSKVEKLISGSMKDTTNNRMELTAVIEALKALKRPCKIEIYTDSRYVSTGITQWIESWIQKKWKGVKNPDLWQELLALSQKHQIRWHWIKAHAGHPENERVDEAARAQALQLL